jgi:mRNA interferase MazF
MPRTTSYRFGDIVLVPFPFTDQSASKKRPAVIVSSHQHDRRRPDVLLMAITSQVRPSLSFGEVTVIDWKKAGFIKPGVVKPIITTAEKMLVIRKLGRLQTVDEKALRHTLSSLLG